MQSETASLPETKPVSLFRSVIKLLLASAVAGFLIGCVYGVAICYSPVAIISIGLVIGAAFLIGVLVSVFAANLKVPSQICVYAAAIFAGLVAVYASWSVNAAIRIDGVTVVALNPVLLFDYGQALYHFDRIEMSGQQSDTEFRGPTLALLWLVEALIITAGAAYCTRDFDRGANVYCKTCKVWQQSEYGILRCGLPPDVDVFADRIGVGETDCIEDLPDGSIDDDPHIRIDVGWCPSCADNCVVTVAWVSFTSQPDQVFFCQNMAIDLETLAKIQARAALAQPDDDERASA